MLSKAVVVLQGSRKPLPMDYPKGLTAAILAKIGEFSPEMAATIHDGTNAYRNSYKVFKPLSHSLLIGVPFSTEKRVYEPGETVCFYLGWREDVVSAFKSAAQKNSFFEISGVSFQIAAVADLDPSPPVRTFNAWGPVLATVSGRKLNINYSYTYLAAEKIGEFIEAVKNNLITKYEAVYGKPYEGELSLSVERPRSVVLRWSEEVSVKGVAGRFRLDCSKELLAFAHSVGLGCKNSIGFGCLTSAV
ncbi:MAG: CRISPR-associated endoribonuclease Cas6 [Thermacetogenium sp.]|nr:CRISPR-associated endoribonuclease Cas6 [Thermacetogenium sp.]